MVTLLNRLKKGNFRNLSKKTHLKWSTQSKAISACMCPDSELSIGIPDMSISFLKTLFSNVSTEQIKYKQISTKAMWKVKFFILKFDSLYFCYAIYVFPHPFSPLCAFHEFNVWCVIQLRNLKEPEESQFKYLLLQFNIVSHQPVSRFFSRLQLINVISSFFAISKPLWFSLNYNTQ